MTFGGNISSCSLNLLFFTQVFSVLSATIKYNEYIMDRGKNLTIPCVPSDDMFENQKDYAILWVKDEANTTIKHSLGSLLNIINATTKDSGKYICLLIQQFPSEIRNVIDKNAFSSYQLLDINNNLVNLELVDFNYIRENFILEEYLTVQLSVRTTPGPVSKLGVRISTIIGVLLWEYKRNYSGGYPLKSFTVEYRQFIPENHTIPWIRLDPHNLAPTARMLEIYHLKTNTTYEFRIWGNNILGSGTISSVMATTLPDLSDEDLLEIILKDAKDFDPRIWLYAVSLVMGTMCCLAIGLCIVLSTEWNQYDDGERPDWAEHLELLPNIILNPGFCEPEDTFNPAALFNIPLINREEVSSASTHESDNEYNKQEEEMSFKRKFSLFFTGDTIKRL